MLTVAHIEPRDVHAGMEHAAQDFRIGARRTDGSDDLGLLAGALTQLAWSIDVGRRLGALRLGNHAGMVPRDRAEPNCMPCSGLSVWTSVVPVGRSELPA